MRGEPRCPAQPSPNKKMKLPLQPTAASRDIDQQYGYYCTNAAMIQKFKKSGQINAPVFLWRTVEEARKMVRRRNGRTIILKAPIPQRAMPDPSHPTLAVLSQESIPFNTLEQVG